MLNDNIKIQWAEIRAEAFELWQKDIESDLLPELDKRSISVDSRMFQNPFGNNDVAITWVCSKNNKYLEIMAMSHRAFRVELFVEGGKPIIWPTRIYEDGNTTVAGLMEWIDSQSI